MPVHLRPISRRQFLARTVAAAGLALQRPLAAAEKPVDRDFWALFSDVHLAADRERVVRGVNMTGHFSMVSRELLSLPKRPAGLFINGDCAFDQGETGDYARLAAMLEPIRGGAIPVHLALGNHDHRERFWNAFTDAKAATRPVADKYVALLPTPRANWFVLDSLETTASTPGLLGREQLDWLANTLDANRSKPALVLIHHNPGLSGNLGLKDTLPLLEIIRPRAQVKAYIFGHTHVWKVNRDSSGIHLVNLPAVAYVFNQAEPSGWVHATLGAAGMKLELRCIDTAHKAHGQVVDLKWRA